MICVLHAESSHNSIPSFPVDLIWMTLWLFTYPFLRLNSDGALDGATLGNQDAQRQGQADKAAVA